MRRAEGLAADVEDQRDQGVGLVLRQVDRDAGLDGELRRAQVLLEVRIRLGFGADVALLDAVGVAKADRPDVAPGGQVGGEAQGFEGFDERAAGR